MRYWTLFLTAIAGLQSPVLAQPAVPCVAMIGDMWGEDRAPADVKTLDGATYRSPQALARAVGDGAIVQGGNFSEWDFRGITLRNACFVDADLKGSVWNGADVAGIGFIRSDISESTMTGVKAPHILLRDAKLSNVKSDRADFSGGLFEGGWFDGSIDGWNIDGTNLTDFAFSCGITLPDGCPIDEGGEGISARGADFTRAKLSSFRRFGLDDMDLAAAVFDRTELSPGQLTSLTGVELQKPVVLVGGSERMELQPQDAATLIADARVVEANTRSPSFDCAKAASATEKLICGDEGGNLAAADRQLAILFGKVRASNPAAVAGQQRWLKLRDVCSRDPHPADCVQLLYSERIGALLGQLGESDWLARGDSALFIDDELPLSDAMRATGLFARIVPVLAAASMTTVVVTREDNGNYTVTGTSVGANAHTCSLDATDMQIDATSGWYSVRQREGTPAARIMRIIGDRMEVFGNGHPDSDVPEASMEYASCGARAAFGPLRRIVLPSAMIEKYISGATIEP